MIGSDFEVKYDSIEINDEMLLSRSNLWLLKALIDHMSLDFDSCLTNRLRLLTSCLNDVKFDIMNLVNAKVISRSNRNHKKSLGSLLLWLYEFLDSRPTLLMENGAFLNDLVSRILTQIKIFPSVFCAAYYDSDTSTTIFAQIRLSTFNSGRLEHILNFNNIIDSYKNQSGMIFIIRIFIKKSYTYIFIYFLLYLLFILSF